MSTASAAARDAYVQGCDLALTLYPGAVEAFDRAIAADPGFAMAQAGKEQVLMWEGQRGRARAALAAAKDLAAGLLAREASHIAFFDLVFAGRSDDTIAALHEHLAAWPRDALVLATAANPNGLIGASGRIGQKHQIAVVVGQPRPALPRRYLVPGPSCHGALRGWSACDREAEDRAIRRGQPQQRAWCARIRACLLREW